MLGVETHGLDALVHLGNRLRNRLAHLDGDQFAQALRLTLQDVRRGEHPLPTLGERAAAQEPRRFGGFRDAILDFLGRVRLNDHFGRTGGRVDGCDCHGWDPFLETCSLSRLYRIRFVSDTIWVYSVNPPTPAARGPAARHPRSAPVSTNGELPNNLPLFLTDADVAGLSDWPGAIEAIRTAYKEPGDEAGTPGRIFAQTPREWLRIMPSVPPSGQLFGAKSIAGSFADGLRVSYLISLFDKDTADLVALVDGNRVTGLRTAATTALGASTIVPQRPLIVGVIGSGFEARSHLTAFSHLLELR